MAQPTQTLIHALRQSAQNLRHGAPYSWGHHGQCNCGHLVQQLTQLSDRDIRAYTQYGPGEWTELAQEFCPVSQAPADLMVKHLLDAGMTGSDIYHLEYLNDKSVLEFLPGGLRWLKRNQRQDAIDYFEAFADLLESKRMVNQLETQPVNDMVLAL